MKKIIAVTILMSTAFFILPGCDEEKKVATPVSQAPSVEVIDNTGGSAGENEEELKEGPGFSESWDDDASGDVGEIGGISEETLGDGGSEDTAGDVADDSGENEEAANPNAQAIVWIGDSLTQGSLGDDGDNLPNAPYEKLKNKVNVPVEGYGLYGCNTNDIFWVYMDSGHYNQTIDPKKTYIFWVGSNDWVVDGAPNSDTSGVIAQIDRFLSLEGTVNNYIVMGTTARYELGDMYKTINASLANKYGKHYLDVIDVIGPDGYGPDKVHLTQKAYDAVTNAVYQKLKALGYI